MLCLPEPTVETVVALEPKRNSFIGKTLCTATPSVSLTLITSQAIITLVTIAATKPETFIP